MKKEYFFLEIDLNSMKIIDYGETEIATLTGNTNTPHVHRIFLTKGQFNKFKDKLQLCTR